MRKFEYKAVPAPNNGTKAKGVKTTQDRFALSLSHALNEMAADGWEYVRAETLPCQERKGLTGSQTVYQNILIFRRLETAALPLDRVTTRPLGPIVAPEEPEPAPEPEALADAEPPLEPEAPPVSIEPPVEGSAPSVRATDS